MDVISLDSSDDDDAMLKTITSSLTTKNGSVTKVSKSRSSSGSLTDLVAAISQKTSTPISQAKTAGQRAKAGAKSKAGAKTSASSGGAKAKKTALSKTAAGVKKAAPKKRRIANGSGDDDDDEEDDSGMFSQESSEISQPVQGRKKTPARAARKKAIVDESSEEEDNDDDDGSAYGESENDGDSAVDVPLSFRGRKPLQPANVQTSIEPTKPPAAQPKASLSDSTKKGKTSKPSAKKSAKPKAKPSKAKAKSSASVGVKRKLVTSSQESSASSSSPLFSEEEEDDEALSPVVSTPQKKGNKKQKKADASKSPLGTIEQIYQKKTQLEHILLRPDTYIGTTNKVTQPMWVLDDATNGFVYRDVTFVPGLYKIFDEIIVNAADNKQRDPAGMTMLKVTIDEEKGSIKIWNNGKGIPIVVHKEHEVYVPELVFGHLLTGSNFNDNQKKTTGGRNGYGAKLTNIFSTEFHVETVDSKQSLKYKQSFKSNMGVKGSPKITSAKSSGADYTCITFVPDFKRFGMKGFDADILALFKKRVYDMAGTSDKTLRVYLNGEKVQVQSFSQYVEMYQAAAGHTDAPKIIEKVNDRWEVGVTVSDGSFQQVSFVNAICTTKGGQHVNYVTEQMVSKLLASLSKKYKEMNLKPAHVRNHLWVFVNCLIDNPSFDSQTKDTLTTTVSAFGSKCPLSEKFLKKLEKSSIVDQVQSWVKYKQTAQLQRKSGTKSSKVTGIAKLDDANFAGTAKGQDCTLILTEGDSAKALAISGLGVVGRDYYGVFPLKGKLLNVREASHAQMMKNDEIQNLVKILGLKFNKEYTDTKSLRYGHLMIMADQDHDGSHIKGLVINFIHHFWPTLLHIPNFLQEFITPIVKASKDRRTEVFYTIPEYQRWKAQNNGGRGWNIKYYKGLGTSTGKEAKEYFSDLGRHQIDFEYLGDGDTDAIDMAFSKKRVQDRKEWLNQYKPGTHVDYDVESMPYSEFINKELVLFSVADNVRSIPSMMDGLKPSQRKVLFSCFKRKLKSEIKVVQLAGYVSEHSAYHHGEASLTSTIVGMAQNFAGSNNINLLVPSGQFGTRLLGGKDAASPRYIFTQLDPITRFLFRKEDDPVLTYLEDDGQSIEPICYVPIIPTVLVNGADGIGTGWSSQVPNYNPHDIIKNIRRLLANEPLEPMTPWYRGYHGVIESKAGSIGNFTANGTFEVIGDGSIRITELPLRTWTTPYKQFLESMLLNANDKEKPIISDFQENHTDTTVLFTVKLAEAKAIAAEENPLSLMNPLKLDGSISTTNMHLFDHEGKIRKFDAPEQVIQQFFPVRLQLYGKRKEYQLQALQRELITLENKARFIEEVISQQLIIANRPKQDLLRDLTNRRYDRIVTESSNNNTGNDSPRDGPKDFDEDSPTGTSKGYDYLLSLKMWSLTAERVASLKQEVADKRKEIAALECKTLHTLWMNDLNDLEEALKDFEARFAQESSNNKQAIRSAASKGAKKSRKRPAPTSSSAGGSKSQGKRPRILFSS